MAVRHHRAGGWLGLFLRSTTCSSPGHRGWQGAEAVGCGCSRNLLGNSCLIGEKALLFVAGKAFRRRNFLGEKGGGRQGVLLPRAWP